MAGLVLYLGMVVLGAYLGLALLPAGLWAGVGIGLALVVAVGGWAVVEAMAARGEADRLGQVEFGLLGVGAALAGAVQAIRLVLPSRRPNGRYGLLILAAPFAAALVAAMLFAPTT